MENILWGYILFMSVLTFSVCGMDKFAAQRQKRRVPEKVLFGLSILGGSVGMYLGMCGHVSVPPQNQALVFCDRHPAHHPDPGGSAALFCAGLMLFLPNK